MTAKRERILLRARDARFARVILGDQAGAQVHVGVTLDQRRIRRDLVSAHRHEAHRLGAAGHDRRREPAHHALGRVGDGLQPRRAEAVHRHRRGLDRNARAQARDPGDVHPLLGLRHRASQNHIIDFRRLDPGRAPQCLANRHRRELVWPRAAKRARRRLPGRRAHSGHDHCVLHDQSPNRSSIAPTTSLTLPSNRWSAASITTSSFGSAARA